MLEELLKEMAQSYGVFKGSELAFYLGEDWMEKLKGRVEEVAADTYQIIW